MTEEKRNGEGFEAARGGSPGGQAGGRRRELNYKREEERGRRSGLQKLFGRKRSKKRRGSEDIRP